MKMRATRRLLNWMVYRKWVFVDLDGRQDPPNPDRGPFTYSPRIVRCKSLGIGALWVTGMRPPRSARHQAMGLNSNYCFSQKPLRRLKRRSLPKNYRDIISAANLCVDKHYVHKSYWTVYDHEVGDVGCFFYPRKILAEIEAYKASVDWSE